MNINTDKTPPAIYTYSLIPQLRWLQKPLQYAIGAFVIILFSLPILFSGYYSDTIMKAVFTVAIIVVHFSFLGTLVWPTRNKQPGRMVISISKVLFALIATNLIVILLALWGYLPNSSIILRYSGMLVPLLLAPLAAYGVLRTDVQSTLGIWVKDIGAITIFVAILMLIPIIYHYVGKSWFQLIVSHPLPQMYFNVLTLMMYTSFGCSLLLIALKYRQNQQNK